jgi:Cu+-exporting ATPase
MDEQEWRMFKMIKDPVCGMVVNPAKAVATTEYKDKTYYFCTADCRTAFEQWPEKFVDQTETDDESSQGSVPGGK